MASPLDSLHRLSTNDPSHQLPEAARTVISLLLFVHLFALALTFFGNYEGADLVPDQARDASLVPRLQAVVRPYMYPLWLDWPLQNHLTYGAPFDFDHYVEVELTPKQATGDAEMLRLPDAASGAGLRANRLRRLAWYVARMAGAPEKGDLLPLAIGGGVLNQNDAAKAQVRCFRHQPLLLGEAGGIDATARLAADERLYAADVFFLPGLDQPQLNKIGEARDVAPVTKPTDGQSQGPKTPDSQQGSPKSESNRTLPLRNPLLPGGNPLSQPAIPPALPPGGK